VAFRLFCFGKEESLCIHQLLFEDIFQFDDTISGEKKLESILKSELTDKKSDWHSAVAFYGYKHQVLYRLFA
jgi:hypothetical protein